MFNRTLKRPMFRIGGQAGQGSGIMSHVEPRANKATGGRIMAAGGYDPRGSYFGYGADPRGTYFGPSQKTPISQTPPGMFDPYNVSPTATTEAEKISAFEKGQAARRAAMNKALQYGKYIPAAAAAASEFGAGFLGPTVSGILAPAAAGFGLGYGRGKLIDYRNQLLKDLEKVRAGQTPPGIDDLGQVGIRPDYYQGKEITPSPGPGKVDPDTGTKEPVTKEAITTSKPDKTETIKKEADYIRSLIDNPDLTKAEIALIIGKSLATPGPIANKIQVASDLSLGLAKERGKTSRDITLKAYENYKDLEKAEIAAGKLSEQQKLINDALNTEMSNAKVIAKNEKGEVTYDGKTVPELRKDVYDKIGLYRESRGPKETIFAKQYEIIQTGVKKIEELENKKRQLESNGKKLSSADEKELTAKKADVAPFVNDPLFDYYFKSAKQYFADGGRAGFAMGTPNPKQAMQQRQPNVQQTVVNQNNQAVPLKPVNNLGFSELRDRLPKEITDDIVMLISKSEEALQEFAYIRTQKDVNDFNVKYGVNLVLPATQNS
jgi:hypothetical protein